MIDEFERFHDETNPEVSGWVESIEIVIGCATTHADLHAQAHDLARAEGESFGMKVAGKSTMT